MRCKKFLRVFFNLRTRNLDEVREIRYGELKKLIKNNIDMQIVDIRSPQEFSEKRIKNAINIPLYDLKKNDSLKLLPDKNRLIILYCACGVRSKKAYKILEDKGYTNLYSLKDGLEGI